jgi:MioC protein
MTPDVTILVATMSGTAEMVADEIATAISDAGGAARVVRMEKASIPLMSTILTAIICSSTYGTGDVPDNGQAFYDALGAERPDLSNLRYGVIALGNSIYPQTFCHGGIRFDERLAALGAHRIGDRLEHDASGSIYADDAALEWIEHWLEALSNASN